MVTAPRPGRELVRCRAQTGLGNCHDPLAKGQWIVISAARHHLPHPSLSVDETYDSVGELLVVTEDHGRQHDDEDQSQTLREHTRA